MIIEFLQQNRILRRLVYRLGWWKAGWLLESIEPYLEAGDSVLDIGAGTCSLAEILQEKQFHVVPVDITNLSFVDNLDPVVSSGSTLPFRDRHFDTALLISVLHHTSEPEAMIRESVRVARKLVIIEDIYTSSFHKYMTFLLDSLLNLECRGHPHANKKDAEWRRLFQEIGLVLAGVQYRRFLLVFKHATYHLKSG